jgi:hypothetical protein
MRIMDDYSFIFNKNKNKNFIYPRHVQYTHTLLSVFGNSWLIKNELGIHIGITQDS